MDYNIKGMDKIIHLDELSNDDFISFISMYQWNKNHEFRITEKIDGQNFSFGLDENNQVYTKTKNSLPIYDSDEYAKFSFMSGLREYHDILVDNFDKLHRIRNYASKIINHKSFETIQIFTEILPSNQTNIIEYTGNEKKIVIFDIKLNGNSILFHPFIDDLFEYCVENLNGIGGWNVYSSFLLEKKELQLADITSFDGFVKVNEPILKSRKSSDREKKNELKNKIQSYKDNIKKKFIDAYITDKKSELSELEPEGVVIYTMDGKWKVKIVDKDSFSEINKNASKHNTAVVNFIRSRKSVIKKMIFNNADIIKNFKKAKDLITENIFIRTRHGEIFEPTIETALEVLYNDMVGEGRLNYDLNQIKTVSGGEFLSIIEFIQSELSELEKTKPNIPYSKYIISKEKLNANLSEIQNSVNIISDTDDIKTAYYEVMKFVLGNTKIKEIQSIFINEHQN